LVYFLSSLLKMHGPKNKKTKKSIDCNLQFLQ